MFPIFEQEKLASYGMIISFVLSMGIRFFLGMLYQTMIHETDNMATTKNRLLKQCKLKFTHCFQLNNGVSNVPVFVDRFLNRLSLGPFSFAMLYHFSGQLMLLSVIFSGVGVCRGITSGSMFGQILPFYIFVLGELYLYFAFSALIDIKGKEKSLKINLIDYLENHLSNRMYVTREDIHMLYGTNAQKTKIKRGLELLPIAGWLADRAEESYKQETMEFPKQQSALEQIKEEGFLEQEESEALEELLKEFLSLS